MDPKKKLAELLSSRDGTVPVKTERQGERVREAAARSDAFVVEPNPKPDGRGIWRVRYVDPRLEGN